MFGLRYLRNYVGKITFFERFSRVMETSDTSSVVVPEEDGLVTRSPTSPCTNWVMRRNLFKGGRSNAPHSDLRLQVVLPLLHRRCQTLCVVDDLDGVPRRYADEKQKVEHELKSILQTLGADLLEHIITTFYNAYREYAKPSIAAKGRASHIYYDGLA
ncbi:hypothetical protein EDC04DRAFT_1586957 [Pisolithus marmoratus]|nr:hypothetical protein EDC04DRAFT_1586957 [Pisolithus marmoratus]